MRSRAPKIAVVVKAMWEELDELVGQLVVPLVFRLESDDLADEGEQGNGQDESAEEQVDLRNDPDCDPASREGKAR